MSRSSRALARGASGRGIAELVGDFGHQLPPRVARAVTQLGFDVSGLGDPLRHHIGALRWREDDPLRGKPAHVCEVTVYLRLALVHGGHEFLMGLVHLAAALLCQAPVGEPQDSTDGRRQQRNPQAGHRLLLSNVPAGLGQTPFLNET